MKYNLIDEKFSNKIVTLMIDSINKHTLYDYFLGESDKTRILCKESFLLFFSDMRVFLEYGVYPLTVNNNVKFDNILDNIIVNALANSSEGLPLFQVVTFFYEQEKLAEIYDELPLYFPIRKYKEEILSKIYLNKENLSNYRQGDFANSINTMYEMIINMINNAKCFQ